MKAQSAFRTGSLVLVAAGAMAVVGCGGGGGGPKSGELRASGVGSASSIDQSNLIVAMPLDAASMTAFGVFVDKAKTYFGAQTDAGGFAVTSAKLGFDISNSGGGISNFQSAFSNSVSLMLKPSAGTHAATPFGTVKSATGSGYLDADVSNDKKTLEPIKEDIFDKAILVQVQGKTPWNQAATTKIGLIVTLELEALK